MTHASKDLVAAMNGVPPPEEYPDKPKEYHAACTGRIVAESSIVLPWAWRHGLEDKDGPVDCPKCIALYPPEIRVRMDYLETRLPPPRCPSCDLGPFIPMSEADGFNHRAVAGSTHVCTACGKGWRP